MKITKLVDQLTAAGLTDYLIQHAKPRGYKAPAMKAPITRGYQRLLIGYDNNRYAVALVTDWLLIHGWPSSDRGLTEGLVTVGVFDYALREMPSSSKTWKYQYFKRFRESLAEHVFFSFWIGMLEDCLVAPMGTRPDRYPDLSWRQLEDRARGQLDGAMETVRMRLDERGSLAEWPQIAVPVEEPGLREFIENPGRPTIAPTRREDAGSS